MNGLTATIAALDDATAVRVLADIADYQARLPDPAQLRAWKPGLHEATTAPALAGYTRPAAPAGAGSWPGPPCSTWPTRPVITDPSSLSATTTTSATGPGHAAKLVLRAGSDRLHTNYAAQLDAAFAARRLQSKDSC